jgi:hypothetical protein
VPVGDIGLKGDGRSTGVILQSQHICAEANILYRIGNMGHNKKRNSRYSKGAFVDGAGTDNANDIYDIISPN